MDTGMSQVRDERLAPSRSTIPPVGHLFMSAGTGLFAVAELGLMALAFGVWARIFAAVSLMVMVAFNSAMSLMVDDVELGVPTPNMGLYERIGIAPWLLWLVVVSVLLLRRSVGEGRELAKER